MCCMSPVMVMPWCKHLVTEKKMLVACDTKVSLPFSKSELWWLDDCRNCFVLYWISQVYDHMHSAHTSEQFLTVTNAGWFRFSLVVSMFFLQLCLFCGFFLCVFSCLFRVCMWLPGKTCLRNDLKVWELLKQDLLQATCLLASQAMGHVPPRLPTVLIFLVTSYLLRLWQGPYTCSQCWHRRPAKGMETTLRPSSPDVAPYHRARPQTTASGAVVGPAQSIWPRSLVRLVEMATPVEGHATWWWWWWWLQTDTNSRHWTLWLPTKKEYTCL